MVCKKIHTTKNSGVYIGVIVNIMVGIMFIILGNYVHKVKQNYTVGMKLPWTLNSEENWNRTNRMTGWNTFREFRRTAHPGSRRRV